MDESSRGKIERREPRIPSETMAGNDLNRVMAAFAQVQAGGDMEEIAEKLAGELTRRGMENIRDPLTGAWSRNYVRAELSHELSSRERQTSGLGVCLIDMDDFKLINDDEPDKHGAGDRTLQAFNKMTLEKWGGAYILGRYGGDEWLAVLPGVTAEDLERAGKELGDEVNARLAGNAKLSKEKVTISIGAAMWDGQEKMDELIQRADGLVSKAKAEKNRMVIQKGPNETPVAIPFGV